MSVAIEKGNVPAEIAAIIAMGVMIIVLDRLLWRPLVIWSKKFRMEESSDEVQEHSVVLNILKNSWLLDWVHEKLRVKKEKDRTNDEKAKLKEKKFKYALFCKNLKAQKLLTSYATLFSQ